MDFISTIGWLFYFYHLWQHFLWICFYYRTHKQITIHRLHSRHSRGPLEACTYYCSTFFWTSYLQENPLHHLAHQVDGCWGHFSGCLDPGSSLCKGPPDQYSYPYLVWSLHYTFHLIHSLEFQTEFRVLQVGHPRLASCRWQWQW